MTETYDPANAHQASAAHLRIRRQELQKATADVTFVATEDSLAESDLVAAFAESFEWMAFASFEVRGMSEPLARRLKSIGNGLWGFLDPYAHRLLSSDAMRARLPELAINEEDALADPDFAMFGAVDPLLLDGTLAMALRDGGPYSTAREGSPVIDDPVVPSDAHSPGRYHAYVVAPPASYTGFTMPSKNALRLASDFRAKLIGDRFDDLHVATGHGWSDWFIEEDSWNHGWLMTDLHQSRIHLLCVTDTD